MQRLIVKPQSSPKGTYELIAQPQPGRDSIAQGEQSEALGCKAMTRPAPTGRDSSVPEIAFVELDLVARQQQPQFILVGDLAVVLFLIGNVGFDISRIRLAYGEGTISRLPVKIAQRRTLPFGPR